MTITVNNHHYLIRFTHHHLSSEIRAYRRKKAKSKYTGEEWTTCIIEQVNDAGELLGGYWDQAFCSLTDQFSKSMGRRISLTRVLLVMFRREERTLAWAAIWAARRKVTDKPWSL